MTLADMTLEVVVLAAGQGKRMYSDLPKVLHALGGRPLLAHVLDRAEGLAAKAVHVVYGHGGDQVRERLAGAKAEWIHQPAQRGTGDAVRCAMPSVDSASRVLVLYGDVPLTRIDTLKRLLAETPTDGVGILTCLLDDPTGYGRIVRDGRGHVKAIVEQRDADDATRAIREINTGIMVLPAKRLKGWLDGLIANNDQGELYLTDIVAMAVRDGVAVATAHPGAAWEIMGVNSRPDLAFLERTHQREQAEALMRAGVTLRDPARFDLRGTLQHGRDVVIDVNVVLEGTVVLGDGATIGPNVVMRNCTVGAGTEILPGCVFEDSVIGAGCRLGPYTRLRPESRIADHVHLGNFVEIKKSEIGDGSKVNHLSYVGDTTVGRKVNVGAGTIVCNYDGANKHRTVIGDNAFIGSDVQLVAPVTIGAGATIGAGSTIVKDAPDGELTFSRAEQRTIRGWKRPVKGEVRRRKKDPGSS